ncbi:MAG: AbrB/MazE/SpoVT family DNA-binding domain-containing protein [Acidobacteria bacterium]|nr:AbrB/MazE/SpoVT family DNA-binding domain-containing protein [Acidobacteriota bacterium]
MSIVTVKNKYQVVIPQGVRKQVSVNVGDLLEAKVEKGKITLTPKAVLDRTVVEGRKGERGEFLRALRAVQADAKRKGLDKLTMRDIDALIAEVRRERMQRTSSKRPVK